MSKTSRKAPVIGQILPVDGGRVVILNETLADVLNLDNWDVVEDTMPKLTPEEEARRKRQHEEWERHVRENPPKRIV